MGVLTKLQFDILTTSEAAKREISATEIAQIVGLSAEDVTNTLSELNAIGYMRNRHITDAGIMALEPYRVQRAVILAAGFGSRMIPITLSTPKPLVQVKGERIIDSLLDALEEVGIQDVIIVRGYLAEQFDILLEKYPHIKFIDNPVYDKTNNISSVLYAKDYLKNAYICEADLLIQNKNIIKKYQYATNFLGVPVEKTDDWCFTSDEGLYITSLKIGGTNCHHVYGISYWNEKDGTLLAEQVQRAFEIPAARERLWDMVPFEYYLGSHKISIRECCMEDIAEIDTFDELKIIDPTYR